MNPIKAIIVDDEPNARKALRGMLNEHFEEVLVLADCGNVPEAVKMINRFKPDLIFLDIDMPGYSGLNISPMYLLSREWEFIGVLKGYTTRVGGGELVTEMSGEMESRLQIAGREVGVTTGRKRRCGWLDLVQLRHSINTLMGSRTEKMVLNLTKLDVLNIFETVSVCIRYVERTPYFPVVYPMGNTVLGEVEPVYVQCPGWSGSGMMDCKNIEELDGNIRNYIRFIRCQ